MTGRICYCAVVKDEHWAVRFDHSVGAHTFVALADAVEAARLLAAERREERGLPSGVQIESPDGEVVRDAPFGPD